MPLFVPAPGARRPWYEAAHLTPRPAGPKLPANISTNASLSLVDKPTVATVEKPVAAISKATGSLVDATRSTESSNLARLLRLEVDGFNSIGSMRLRMDGRTNKTYRVEVTTNFQTWADLGTMDRISNHFEFCDSFPTNTIRRFYRAVEH
jgi:hypothetical protein